MSGKNQSCLKNYFNVAILHLEKKMDKKGGGKADFYIEGIIYVSYLVMLTYLIWLGSSFLLLPTFFYNSIHSIFVDPLWFSRLDLFVRPLVFLLVFFLVFIGSFS